MEGDLASIHKQFPAAAEYLSTIYVLQRDCGQASHTRLARWNNVSIPAVSQAMSRLRRLGLVRQRKYGHVTLTEDGRDLAIKVLKRHYLVERLLVGVLGYPWDKVDEEAKRLQTAISDELCDHLFRRFGSPQTCPHGNPMPDSPIEARLLGAPTLCDAREGQFLEIVRITEEGEQLPSMLSFCHHNGIEPGARFRIGHSDTDGIRLEPAGELPSAHVPASILVSPEYALHIRYETLS